MKHFITTVVPNWLRKRFSREKPFQGTLDAIIDGRVLGWARSADHDGPIRIDLLIDGRVVAIDEPANVLRPDLRDAGIGDGAYGFEIAVPPECLGPDTLSVTIRPHGSEQAGLTQSMRFHREHGEYRPLQSINAASDITITSEDGKAVMKVERTQRAYENGHMVTLAQIEPLSIKLYKSA